MAVVLDKASGQLIEVADPAAGLAQGTYGLPTDQPVHVVNPDGQVGTVDPTQDLELLRNIAQGRADGWRFAHSVDVTNAEDEANYGSGVGNTLLAGAAGAASTLTGGASDAYLDVLDEASGRVFDLRRANRELAERHGGARVAGQIAGGVAGLASSLGGTVAGAVTRGSLAAERAVGGAIAEAGGNALARVGGKAAGAIVGGAIEGTAAAAQQLVTEQALGSPPVTAQQAIAAIGHGALFGGVLGGGVNIAGQGIAAAGRAIGSGVRAATRSIREAVEPAATQAVAQTERRAVQRVMGEVGEQVPDEVADDVARVVSARERAQSAALTDARLARHVYGDEAGDLVDRFARDSQWREAASDLPGFQDRIARELKSETDALNDGFGRMQRRYVKGMKPEVVARAMPMDPPPESFQAMRDLVNEGRRLPELISEAQGVTWRKTSAGARADEVLGAFDSWAGRVEAQGLSRETASEAYLLLDQLKRTMDTPIEGLQARGMYDVANTIQAYTDRIRGALEDEGLWGQVGAAQRAINEPWSRGIAVSKALDREAFQLSGHADEFTKLYEAKPQYLLNMVREPDGFVQAPSMRKYAEWIDAHAETVEAMAQYSHLDADDLAFVQGVRGRQARIDELLDQARQGVSARQAADTLKGLISDNTVAGGLINVAQQAPAVLAFAGGPIGLAAGVGVKAVTARVRDPLETMMRRFRQADRVAANPSARTIADRLGGGLMQIAHAAERTRDAISRAGRALVGDVTAGQAMRRVVIQYEAADFGELAQQTLDAQPDDMQAAAAPYVEHAPETAAAMASTANLGINYLRSHLPPEALPTPWDPGRIQEVSDLAAWDWLARAQAVREPLSVLDGLAQGLPMDVELDAIRSVYPDIYQQLRDQALYAAQTSPLTIEARSTLLRYFPDIAPPAPSGALAPPPPAAGGPPPGPAPRRPMDISTNSFAGDAEAVLRRRAQ